MKIPRFMPPTGLDPHMRFEDILADAAPPTPDPLEVEGIHLLADLINETAAALEDVERRLVDGNGRTH